MKKLFAIPLLVLSASCGVFPSRTQRFTRTTADAMNAEFIAVRTAIQSMTAALTDTYIKSDAGAIDLSSAPLDRKDGGVFESYRNYTYYHKPVKQGACLYYTPGRPLDADMRRALRMMLYLEPPVIAAQRSSDVINAVFYGTLKPHEMAWLAPWNDVVSIFPPGISFEKFEWFSRGLNSGGEARWSGAPFTDLFSGWVVDISMPVVANGTVRGVAVINMAPRTLARKYLTKSSRRLLFVGPDMTLMYLTETARAVLDLHVLEDFNYTRQMKENTFAPTQFKLSDSSQRPEIRALADMIVSGKRRFDLPVKGTMYRFYAAPVTETGYWLVGFE